MDRTNPGYRNNRKLFIFKTYFIFLIFGLISLAEYAAFITVGVLSNFFLVHTEWVVTCFSMALLLLTIFVFVENVRYVTPLSWLLAMIVVEGFTLGLARTIVHMSLEELFICFAFVAVVMGCCMLLATCLPHDFTLDVIIIFVLSFIFFIAAVYFVTLFALAHVEFSLHIFSGLVTFIVCIFILYHTQTIHGGRYAELRSGDYILASLILYIDFTILLLLSFYFVPKVWNCLIKNM